MSNTGKKSWRIYTIIPTGFVLINCETSHVDYVIEQLKKIDAVKEIQGVFGMYDVIIKIKVDDKDIFTKVISVQVRTIDKVKSTLTLMVSNPEGNYLWFYLICIRLIILESWTKINSPFDEPNHY